MTKPRELSPLEQQQNAREAELLEVIALLPEHSQDFVMDIHEKLNEAEAELECYGKIQAECWK